MKRAWYDDPARVRLLTRLLWVACGLSLVAGLIAPSIWPAQYDHLHYAWEGFFLSYAGFGFLAFVALVTLARWLKPILWRRPGFYDDRRPLPGEGEDP